MLHAAEIAARGHKIDWKNPHALSDDEAFVLKAVKSFCSQIKSLLLMADSSRWNTGFLNILRRSTSMRVRKMSLADAGRPSKKCAVCGNHHGGTAVVDLAGNCAPTRASVEGSGQYNSMQWLSCSPGDTASLFAEFLDAYMKILDKATTEDHDDSLCEWDFGEFHIGNDCLRHVKLAFVGQNLPLELAYGAAVKLYEMGGSDTGYDFLPTCTPEAITSLISTKDSLEISIADRRRAVPEVPFDGEFWEIVDLCRQSRRQSPRERANEYMNLASSWENEELMFRERDESVVDTEEEEGEEEDEEEGEEDEEVVIANLKRRRMAVIEDDEEEEEVEVEVDEEEEAPPRKKRKRRVYPLPEGGVRRSGRIRSGVYAPAPAPAAQKRAEERAEIHPREVQEMTAAQHASIQRIPGDRLPARKYAISNGSRLSARLQLEDREEDAAVVTQLVFVAQELLAKVASLQRTDEGEGDATHN